MLCVGTVIKIGPWINLALYILVNQGFIIAFPLQAPGRLFCLIDFVVLGLSQLDTATIVIVEG